MRYTENSGHSLSVIVRGSDGAAYYSGGLGATVLMSEVFKGPGEGAGTLLSKEYTSQAPIQALRLKTTESLSSQGGIAYSYSVDGGASWIPFAPQRDAIFEKPYTTVQLRAEITGDAALRGWEVQAISEMRPQRFTVSMLRDVGRFGILCDTRIALARGVIRSSLPDAVANRWLWADDKIHGDSFRYDVVSTAEELSRHTLRAIGVSEGQVLYGGEGADARILLREARDDTGIVLSGPLTPPQGIQAVRLEALSGGKQGRYYISANNHHWTEIQPTEYHVLDTTEQLWLKAEMPAGSTLRGWHLEGVTVGEKAVRVEILKPVTHLDVRDFGAITANRRYELTWQEPNVADPTLGYTQAYEVYRNGVKLAETTRTSYTDSQYLENAVYSVRVTRAYRASAPYALRCSPAALGAAHKIAAPPVYEEDEYVEQKYEQVLGIEDLYTNPPLPEVQVIAAEYQQAQFLSDLYGGMYTMDPNAEPPSAAAVIEQYMLGAPDRCILGLEPINFNTGNFFMTARDYSRQGLTVTRTYNAQSSELNGPFGGRWASELTMHLTIYGDGSLGLRDSEGALSMYYRQADGSFVMEGERRRTLSLSDCRSEYLFREADGTTLVFNSAGLLKGIRKGGADVLAVERDERGLITALSGASGLRLPVEMDEAGHITRITTPGGRSIRYAYKGNDLVSVTDELGHVTRYVYDEKGRMIKWFDAAGNQQMDNVYDERDRVVYQEDAMGGKYTLEYFEDHTVVTDVTEEEGMRIEVYIDEKMRTARTVDSLGNEARTEYGERGDLLSSTDERGQETTYAYDARGNRVLRVNPDGSTVHWTYDGADNLTSVTDQAGNVTRYAYDAAGNKIGQINADGGELRFTYNENGQMLTATNALGNTSAFEYDEDGNLITETDALATRQRTHTTRKAAASP